MSTMESLQAKIADCENYLAIMREDIVANEKYLYNLNIELQKASAAEPWLADCFDDDCEEAQRQAEAQQAEEELTEIEDEEELEELEAARQVEELEAQRQLELEVARQNELEELSLKEELFMNHPVGTKLKWVLNEDTYRVAIVKKNGVIQVKSVTDGIASTTKKMFALNPQSFLKTLFANEAEWRNSLPSSGEIIATQPQMNDAALKSLSCKPLTADTDAGKLKELQDRFAGGVFVLSTEAEQMEIEYFYHTILCRKKNLTGTSFQNFGVPAGEKPSLMVEWRGLYISLSHLF